MSDVSDKCGLHKFCDDAPAWRFLGDEMEKRAEENKGGEKAPQRRAEGFRRSAAALWAKHVPRHEAAT